MKGKRKRARRDGGVVGVPVSEQALVALEALVRTGFFGPSVERAASELLHRALCSPEIVEHWKRREVTVR